MGKTENFHGDHFDGIKPGLMDDLTEEEREILRLFRQASPEKQAAAIAMAEEMTRGRDYTGEVPDRPG